MSCNTQLLEFLEDLIEAMDAGKDADVIYLDFKKALDKLPHKRLLKKKTMGLWYLRKYLLLDQRLS